MPLIRSKNFTEDNIPDQTGRVIIITGGTSGLGLTSAIALAKKNAHVIIGARSDKKGQEAVEKIKQEGNNPSAIVEYGIMEQTDMKSVKKFSQWFLERNLPLHVLLLNAGICMVRSEIIDGVENTMLVNHVSHHYLASLLLQKLEESGPSRIVFVASFVHLYVMMSQNWAKVLRAEPGKSLGLFMQYGKSKLANILDARQFAKILGPDSKVVCNAIDPGPVQTNLGKEQSMFEAGIGAKFRSVFDPIAYNTVEEGILSQIYASVHPEIDSKHITGRYFVPYGTEKEPSKIARDEKAAQELWDLTEAHLHRIMGNDK